MDSEQVSKILRQDFPQLQIDTVVEMPRGWRNYVFLINNKLIVRFPRQSLPGLEQQQKILNRLSKEIKYRLPTIHYLDPKRCYTVYSAILACSYSKQDFYHFTKEEKQRIAFELADFLWQMHSVYTFKELEQVQVSRFDYEKEVVDISKESREFANLDIPKNIKQFVMEQAKIARYHLGQGYAEVLIHNDLHIKNIILDCQDKRLNGVIDFDDMKVGHYHLDFVGFAFSLPIDVTLNIVKNYERLSDWPVLFDYVLAIATDYVSSNLIKYPDNKELWKESLEVLGYLSRVLNYD